MSPSPRVARIRQTALLILGSAGVVPCLARDPSRPQRAQCPRRRRPRSRGKAPDKLVIDADELVYDKDKNTVSAVGSVQLFYQGRILQADRVIYNRATKRVYAEGHAKMTDEHGDVVYGSRFELSDNFREGFIDSVQVLTSDKTRFTSPRVERSNGDVTVLRKGRLHRLRALQGSSRAAALLAGARGADHREPGDPHGLFRRRADARLGRAGLLHALFFVAGLDRQQADRRAGAAVRLGLQPRLRPQPALFHQSRAKLRSDADSDLPVEAGAARRGRLAPAPVERHLQHPDDRDRRAGAQPVSVLSLWRRRPAACAGSVETKGNFFLNQNWQFGWNATWLSDKFFANDYKLQGIDFSNYYFQDVVSSVYLRGQADHSFFDLSAYHFEGTTPNDDNRTLPVAAPVFDYNRVFACSGRPHLRHRRRGDGRHQCRQHRPHQRGVPVDRPADVRQRLPPLQCLRDDGRRTNT